MSTTTPPAGAGRRPRLADPSRCPQCSAPLAGGADGPRCAACGLELVGPTARQLWQANVEADRWLAERERLIAVLRAEQARRSDYSRLRQDSSRGRTTTQPSQPRPVPPPRTPREGEPRRPVRRGIGVQTLLVGLGALLLAAATIVFLFLSWESLGLAGRAAIVAVGTLAVLAGAGVAQRVRLHATAEAMGTLGVVLVLLDVWAVRATGLAGDEMAATAYAAVGAAVAAAVVGAWGLVARVRAGTLAASVLVPAVPVLGGLAVAETLPAGSVTATVTVGLALGSATGLLRGLRRVPELDLERRVLAVVAAVLAGAAGAGAVLTRFDDGAAPAALLLAVVAAVTAAHASLARTGVSLALWAGSSGALLATAAVMSLSGLGGPWQVATAPAAAGAVAVAARLAASTAPAPSRSRAALRASASTAVVVTAAAGVPAAAVWSALAATVPFSVLVPWSARAVDQVGTVLGTTTGPASRTTLAYSAGAVVGLLAVTAVAVAWRRAGGHRSAVQVAAVTGLAAAVGLCLVPTAAIWASVSGLLVVAVLVAGFGVRVAGRPSLAPAVPVVLVGAWGVGLSAVLLAWTVEPLSVPLTLVGIVGLVVARVRWTSFGAALLSVSLLAVVVSVAAVAVSAGAGSTWAGAWAAVASAALAGLVATAPGTVVRPALSTRDRAVLLGAAVASYAVGLLVVAAGMSVLPLAVPAVGLAAGAVVAWAPWRRVGPVERSIGAVVAVALGALTAATTAQTWDLLPAWVAAAVAVTAALVVAALLARAGSPLRTAVEAAAGGVGLLVLAGTATGPADELWLVLAVLAVGALVTATLPDRGAAGWLALALGTGSLWVRLAEGGVLTVEAYTLPPAAVLLVVAAVQRRLRDTDPVLLAGAALAVLPTAVAGVAGPPWRGVAVLTVAVGLLGLAAWARRTGTPVTTLPLALASVAVVVGPWLRSMPGTGAETAVPEVWSVPAAVVVALAAWFARGDERTRQVLGRWDSWLPGASVVLAGLPTLAAVDATTLGTWRTLGVLLLGAGVAAVAVRLGEPVWPPGPTLTATVGLSGTAALVGLVSGDLPAPETVLVPFALLLLGLGLVALRRDRGLRTAPALGPGLAALLLPSLLLAFVDPATWRVVGLAVVATAVVVAGAVLRWQAPLVGGAVVLAVHALVQTWPQLVLLYEAVPRWLSLGVAGAVLLALGARYERRLRDLRTVRTRVGAMR